MYAINSFVFIPKDYSDRDLSEHFIAFAHSKNAAAYLFLPAFASGEDLEILKKLVPIFDGVYADSPLRAEIRGRTAQKHHCGLGTERIQLGRYGGIERAGHSVGKHSFIKRTIRK